MARSPAARDNSEQAQAWNGDQGRTWLCFEDEFHASIRGYGDVLLEAAKIQPGDQVLDIGCGMGSVTRLAARQAGSGRVVGLDLSHLMICQSRERARENKQPNLLFEVGDAQSYGFEQAVFDVVISRFGVMFFADPVAAFANIRVAIRRGGRLAMIIWQPIDKNEWQLEIRGAVAQGRELPRPELGKPGPFSLGDRNYARSILAAAGWSEIQFQAVRMPYLAGRDAAGALTFLSQQSVVRSLLTELDEPGRNQAIADLRDSICRHETDQGVAYGSAAWLMTART